MSGTRMKIMSICLALVAGGAAAPAHAALSGYWDSSKVLHAILGNDEVAEALKQQPIETITATESGYEIKSSDCKVEVAVERRIVERPGPAPFAIRVGQATCK